MVAEETHIDPMVCTDSIDDSGSSTKITTSLGDTILHHAVRKVDNESIVEYLLEIGLNPDQPNYNGLTPFEIVTQNCNEKMIQVLGPSSHLRRSDPKILQFFQACEMGNETAVDLIIQSGLSVNDG